MCTSCDVWGELFNFVILRSNFFSLSSMTARLSLVLFNLSSVSEDDWSTTSFVILSNENFKTPGWIYDLRPTRTRHKSPQLLEIAWKEKTKIIFKCLNKSRRTEKYIMLNTSTAATIKEWRLRYIHGSNRLLLAYAPLYASSFKCQHIQLLLR